MSTSHREKLCSFTLTLNAVCLLGVLTVVQGECSPGIRCVNGTCPEDDPLSCQCHNGFAGTQCEIACPLQCNPNNSRCWYDYSRKEAKCNCVGEEFDGPTCDDLVTTTIAPTSIAVSVRIVSPDVPSDYWYPIGLSLGVLVILILLTVLVPYILWRRRVILMMKLLYRFQKFEDNDSLPFDAFISYKSSLADYSSSPDEWFVIQTLLPKLEQEMGFKLCVHFRDFIPGETITNNVLWAIQNSRRTIMLVSPRYIEESVWCRLEYQQAQQAVMERKQRIIPIMFENIDHVEIEDFTLKHILSSITYMEWPGKDDSKVDQFWTRLYLSMPKLQNVTAINDIPMSVADDTHNVIVDEIGTTIPMSAIAGTNHVGKDATETIIQLSDIDGTLNVVMDEAETNIPMSIIVDTTHTTGDETETNIPKSVIVSANHVVKDGTDTNTPKRNPAGLTHLIVDETA